MNNYKFIISGKVQKVSYRKITCANFQKENFKGYVKNLSNGDVEACVTCKQNDLKKFIDILKQGSLTSEVTNITQTNVTEVFTNDFQVKR